MRLLKPKQPGEEEKEELQVFALGAERNSLYPIMDSGAAFSGCGKDYGGGSVLPDDSTS